MQSVTVTVSLSLDWTGWSRYDFDQATSNTVLFQLLGSVIIITDTRPDTLLLTNKNKPVYLESDESVLTCNQNSWVDIIEWCTQPQQYFGGFV